MADSVASSEDVETLRSSYERDGYLIFDPGIAEQTIDGAIASTQPEFYEESGLQRALRRARRAAGGRHKTLSGRHPVRVQDAWTISEEVKEIARAPRVLEILRQLYDREPLPFQTITFSVGSQQHPHSDAWHFNSEPPGFMCGVWVALEDIDERRGPVVYYPGSHRLSEVGASEVEAARGSHDNAAYEELIQEVIAREGLEAHQAILRKGEALLWSSNLLHGGSPQLDRSLSRWSQVTHYFFEGCRFWQPIHSEDGERNYWKPTFIR